MFVIVLKQSPQVTNLILRVHLRQFMTELTMVALKLQSSDLDQ